MEYVIYKITTLNDGISYYGRSQEFDKRKRAHLNMLRNNEHNNLNLQKSYNGFGESNLEFSILHSFDDLEESIEKELEYINDPNLKKHNVSNSAVGGGDNFTNNPDKERIRQLRIKQMSGSGNHQYGKPKTKSMIDSVKRANSKKIEVDGKLYNSITEYSKESGMKISTISYRVKNKNYPNFKLV